MSLSATSYVIKRSFGNQIRKLIMIVIADFTGDDTGTAWAAIDTLAHRAECSRRSVQAHLDELEAAGDLVIYRNGGPGGTHRFRILFKNSGGDFPRPWGGANDGAPSAPPCKRRTVKPPAGGADGAPPFAPKTGKTGMNGENTPPLPPHEGGEAGADAALVSECKLLRRKWQASPHLSRREARHFGANRAMLAGFCLADWKLLRRFMAAALPPGAPYFRPDLLWKFLENPGALLGDARHWDERQRPRAAPTSAPPVAWAAAPPMTRAEIAEILNPGKP